MPMIPIFNTAIACCISLNMICACCCSDKNMADFITLNTPDLDTSFKTYMSYRSITDIDSEQYAMQRKAWTDENGLRRYNNDYMIAVGSYYSSECGDRFKITLDTGNSFTAVVGDIKDDLHTDDNNMYTPVYDENGEFISANVIEFIADTKSLPYKVKLHGSVGAIEDFSGNIENIERIII